MPTFHPKTPKKCPPKSATSPDGIYFRIVINDPPIPKNFVIWVEEPYNNQRLRTMTRQGDCRVFAVSMFSTEAATLRKLNLFRQAWEKRKILYGDGFLGIAKVKLDLTSGKIKQTSQDTAHYSLWPYVNSRLERNVISVKGA